MANEKTARDFVSLLADAAVGLTAIEALVDDLEGRLTAARAGYLDSLNGHVAQTGDSFVRLGAPAGASVSADVATVDANVDTLVTRLPGAVVPTAITGPTAIDVTTTNDTVTETTLVEVTGVTKLTHVVIDIDLSAAAQSKTIRFYTKPNGTDYQIMDPVTSWTTADQDGLHFDVWVQDDYKLVTLNTSVGEAVQIDGQHVRMTHG